MFELCLSETWNKTHFSSLLISNFMLFFSFIVSHPLYFSYFIFFSPYLFKLLSFLFPLFITTFLSFLSLLPFTQLPEIKPKNHLQTAYDNLVGTLKSSIDDDVETEQQLPRFEDSELYKIVFEPSEFEERSCLNPSSKKPEYDSSIIKGETLTVQDSVQTTVHDEKKPRIRRNEVDQKRLENFLQVLDKFESMASNVEKKKGEYPPTLYTKADKVVEKQRAALLERTGSEANASNKKISTFANADSPKVEGLKKLENNQLGTYGSMRKEKEWKRTLACKLFEERHTVDGGEGMDSLWETYETDPVEHKAKNNHGSKKKMINSSNNSKTKKKNSEVEFHKKDDDYEDDDDGIDGGLCCLQALKLSAGKMNLGMGRPNLLKISKAIKGFGWLHHVTRHGKKVHNNSGERY